MSLIATLSGAYPIEHFRRPGWHLVEPPPQSWTNQGPVLVWVKHPTREQIPSTVYVSLCLTYDECEPDPLQILEKMDRPLSDGKVVRCEFDDELGGFVIWLTDPQSCLMPRSKTIPARAPNGILESIAEWLGLIETDIATEQKWFGLKVGLLILALGEVPKTPDSLIAECDRLRIKINAESIPVSEEPTLFRLGAADIRTGVRM